MGRRLVNVDDFEPQRYVRSAVLRAAGYEVLEAATGAEALRLARAERPDLIVLDVHLPDIDGLEVCRRIKADPEIGRETMVLHVSATFRDAASRVAALDNGADGYLAEPVAADELVAHVGALLRLAAAEEEARQARKAAEAERAQLEAVYQAMMDGVTVFGMDGRIVFVNDAVARFCGFDSAAAMRAQLPGGEPVFELFELDGTPLPRDRWPVARALRGEAVLGCELETHRLHTEQRRVISYSARPVFDSSGQQILALVVSRDVTDRKRTEQALHDEKETAEAREAEISSIYDSAPIGLCIFDPGGRYLRINRRLADINGITPEDHVGRTIREVVPGIADQAESILRQVVESGEPVLDVEIVGELPSAPGVVRTWTESWCPVKGPGGRVIAVNVAAEEITARKRMEEELRRANQIKDDFLATLSHELRTPLNAILGWSHLLERGGLDETMTRQALNIITRNAHAQRQLVSDVLDVSRMMSGKLRLEPAEVDITEVIGQAVAAVQPTLDAKGLRLEIVADTSCPVVTADPNRLQQVVWNLLTNAAKFTPTGGRITLRVHRRDGDLEIVITDTGAGISPAFLPYVFDRFSQADSSMSRRHGGLGLGLSIVRQLVELHGGRVSAASEGEGRGSTFTVSLPVRAVRRDSGAVPRAQPAPGRGEARCGLEGLRVLVVDDMEDARTLVRTVVERAGGTPLLAPSGRIALEMIARTPPDVVVADIGMPEMDGYEFLENLRAGDGTPVPVIALTAYGSAIDRETAMAAGFVEHLTKPVMPEELVAVLARFRPKALVP